IGERILEGAGGESEAHGCVAAAFQIEGLHQLRETARGDDEVVLRNRDVVEEDVGGGCAAEPHQLLAGAKAQTGGAVRDVNGTDPLGSRRLIQTAIDDVAVRRATARAPALGAVENDSAVANLPP